MDNAARNQIKDEIVAAFASASPSMPADLALLPEPAEGEERHLELELQGRPWTTIDRDFWLRRWSSFSTLLPASYRYYLPSLLLHSLDDLAEAGGLVGDTLIVLTPSFRRLLDPGRDRRFEFQTSLITREQQAAVCSFLGLLLTVPEWKFRSAKALRFGWHQIDHSALNQCRAFYDGLHHYVYPRIEDDEQRHLIEAIRGAFAERPYPGDDQLCGSDFMIADVLGEAGNSDPVFCLTHGLYEETPFSLALLQPEAQSASGLTSEEIEWLQESIRRLSQIDWHAYALRRFGGFTPPERQAIVRYLTYRAVHVWDFEAKKINEALESYWKPSLDQG